MYSEWASLQHAIENNDENQSVLHKFPSLVGKEVVCSVVRHLSQSLNEENCDGEEKSLTDHDISWMMEVICYGLNLPFIEANPIKECVNIYCDWLTALTNPKPCIPNVIIEDPNYYCCKIINHLLNLFVPRPDAGVDLVKRQAMYCHRVLRTLQTITKQSSILSRQLWETLLKFLLAANDNLLSPPLDKENGLSSYDTSDHLCERTVTALFETWLLACHRLFPCPPLWKTFREMTVNWRHHESVITQWHRINHVLTSKLIANLYGPYFPALHINDDDGALIPEDMSAECISQSWFRFLHILHNPVDLCHRDVISQTPKFLAMAYSSDPPIDPVHHECLDNLPAIFFKAMRGISVIVNAFLGIEQSVKDSSLMSNVGAVPQGRAPPTEHVSTTPPNQRRPIRPFSVVTAPIAQKVSRSISSSSTIATITAKTSLSPTLQSHNPHFMDAQPILAPDRAACNSILHLVGAWLFEGALANVKLHSSHASPTARRSSLFSDSSIDTNLPQSQMDNTYEAGRAESCGTLCRIFSTHKTGEDILAVYLSRFYIVMYYGLQTGETMSGQVLSNILFNSCDLLRVDLAGIHILVPYFINAVELVLLDNQPRFSSGMQSTLPTVNLQAGPHEQIPKVELRKACIHLLLSIVCLPLHLKDVQIKDIVMNEESRIVSFSSLRVYVIEILHKALLNETDPHNTQMLLGGLLLILQDIALYEETEETTIQSGEVTNVEPDLSVSEVGKQGDTHQSTEQLGPETSLSRLYQTPKDMNTAHGLFGHAISLVCNRLMATWKMDLNCALAAMEVLSGLAQIQLHVSNDLMCKRTVKWICDFIVFQCSRPAPSHSRDLHSMIVAAFQCLTLWLIEHSSLLHDRECLHCVLEVVELGISGSKSQNKASDIPKYKGDKQLMPASKRVNHAAEGVLSCIIDHVGAFPPPCGPVSLHSLLDENSLLRYVRGTEEQRLQFRYFILDNSILIGLLEQPIGNNQDPQPTVTTLVRGPFGRHAWTMQMCHCPRSSKNVARAHLSDPGRPMPMDGVGVTYNIKHRYFPEIVDSIPLTNADRSIPTMESLTTGNNAQQLDMLRGFIESQTDFENDVQKRQDLEVNRTLYPNPDTECKAPSIVHEYQTARLFLSHYSCLSLEALKEQSNSSLPADLVMLDSSNLALFNDLDALDSIETREPCTLHVFYVKSGQTAAEDIVKNVTSKTAVQPHFLEFIHALGWPVSIKKHFGWTGHLSTTLKSVNVEDVLDDQFPSGTGGSAYDGRDWVLYWANVSVEVAVVVPSIHTYLLAINSATQIPTNVSLQMPNTRITLSGESAVTKPHYLSLDMDSNEKGSNNSPKTEFLKRGQLRRQPEHMIGPNIKVFAVWLENFEDRYSFPTGHLLQVCTNGMEHYKTDTIPTTEKDVTIIFIHPLQSGLFRIHIRAQSTKISTATPLLDGMVVSRRTLGHLIRQTTVNIHHRKRLESESYNPPHVRRKLKIQEILFKYQMTLSEADFYTALFEDVSKK